MEYLKPVFITLWAAICLVLGGCGSSSNGSFNPAPTPSQVSTSTPPSFSNTSSATGKFAIALAVDRPSLDANIGQLLATANIQGSDGATVENLPVTFSVAAGPATVDPALTTVPTDSNGKAMSIVTPGNVLSTTNVILMAATTIDGKLIRAYATFQIVRGTGTIEFVTSKAPTDPDGTLVTLDKTVDANFAGKTFEFMQQLPIKLTDANGNPRVGVPVTITVDNQLTGKASTIFKNPTVITDSAGKGIFNVGVVMTAPPQGVTHTDSIIYKAVTTEASGVPSLLTYTGFVVSMTTKYTPLAITPGSASFGSATDLSFTITGGIKPYSVSSSNPPLVSTLLQPDGSIVTAHLVDSSAWTAPVSISVTDAAGNTASASVAR
ncbi:lipoprotein, putative [Citrifermentans bemidjiense Bem]|uniref:Lipoprotein, putative n=1 Tax=Citrifermentans bemidjiense (strain ATCC BAA-1014 / DSM 16622 / JCM 12645 / Bem) TaxID=404380 RepID=B5EAZ5_CITBB|nr:hypothetical protein [Citrifermentans bemidjiense]ACH38856.2 lipoprotein, putative [Citrifermentans bemidjiense Bem]